MTTPCAICGDTEAEFIALHHSGDPWERDAPYKVALCREHQRALIEPVQDAIKKMRDEREVAHVSNRN